LRAWRWNADGALLSAPVRCKREQHYLARGKLVEGAAARKGALMVRFLCDGEVVAQDCLELAALHGDDSPAELLGWVTSPPDASHLQLHLEDLHYAALFEQVVLHPVAERDPKCHPLANVPPPASYCPPFPLHKVWLPSSLGGLAALLPEQDVGLLEPPDSIERLAQRVRRSAWVLDPAWAKALAISWNDLRRLAENSWMIVDLVTLATLLERAGAATTRVVVRRSAHDIMSARVEYADVPTRGFALQDVFPYAWLPSPTEFAARVLLANRSWKRFADDAGFATLLASETPWEDLGGDVLSAACPVGGGELIATDLPWLVAGRCGRLLAPRLAAHALRMHLGAPLREGVRYWNRWEETGIVVRDISDLARRYPPLRTVRWADTPDGVARLGIWLPAREATQPPRFLLIRTGRIDSAARHGGLPAEPMVIFMRELARRGDAAAADEPLNRVNVIWQFDAAVGLRYAHAYEAATAGGNLSAACTVHLRRSVEAEPARGPADDREQVVGLPDGAGIYGDGSLAFQARLLDVLEERIARASH